jgi:hypothetical protein
MDCTGTNRGNNRGIHQPWLGRDVSECNVARFRRTERQECLKHELGIDIIDILALVAAMPTFGMIFDIGSIGSYWFWNNHFLLDIKGKIVTSSTNHHHWV